MNFRNEKNTEVTRMLKTSLTLYPTLSETKEMLSTTKKWIRQLDKAKKGRLKLAQNATDMS